MYSFKDKQGVTHYRAKLTHYNTSNGKKIGSYPELYVGDKIKFHQNVYGPIYWQRATVVQVGTLDNSGKYYWVEFADKTRKWINGINWTIKFIGVTKTE